MELVEKLELELVEVWQEEALPAWKLGQSCKPWWRHKSYKAARSQSGQRRRPQLNRNTKTHQSETYTFHMLLDGICSLLGQGRGRFGANKL
jgi:hypothetical protein